MKKLSQRKKMVSFLLHAIVFFHVEQRKILVVNFRTGVFHDIMPFFIINHLSLVNLFFFFLKPYSILNPNIWQPCPGGGSGPKPGKSPLGTRLNIWVTRSSRVASNFCGIDS